MPDTDFLKIIKMFDTFVVLLNNPWVNEQINIGTIEKAFQCAHFLELTISKLNALGKEHMFETYLHDYWISKKSPVLYKCSDLQTACDKLLEIYLKDARIPTEIVHGYIKLYTTHCGSERLNKFLKSTLVNAVCVNLSLESLESLGMPASDMYNESLRIYWETSIENGNLSDVAQNISRMCKDGHFKEMISILTNSHDQSKVRPVILKYLLNELVQNNTTVYLMLLGLEKKCLRKLLESDSEFFRHFADTVFYFARQMRKAEGTWVSHFEVEYRHLIKAAKVLLSCSSEISDTMYSRIQLVKTVAADTVWHTIESDIGLDD